MVPCAKHLTCLEYSPRGCKPPDCFEMPSSIPSTGLLALLLDVERHLARLGWDKTSLGWLNVHTGQRATMEAALQQELDKANTKVEVPK